MQNEIREVVHQFTPEEMEALKEKFFQDQVAISDLIKEKKASAKSYANRIKSREEQHSQLMQKMRDKQETRAVECEPRPNYTTRMMEFYSVMTGELVDQRRMTPDERQLEIPVLKRVANS